MASTSDQGPVALAMEANGVLRRRVSRLTRLGRLARKKPLGAIAAGLVMLVMFAAVSADVIAPYDFYRQSVDERLQPSSSTYLLGTDSLGRDILSRIIFGARISIFVGLLSVTIGVGHGTIWGVISGYAGGKFDLAVQRIMDIIMAIPFLIMALVIVATFGQSLWNVVFALAFVVTPRVNRIVRGSVITTKENQYIEAARSVGARPWRIVFLHVLPNVMAPIIVVASLDLGSVIIAEASLSFLGLGVPPPTPTWGGMLSGEGRYYMTIAPWIALWPGIAITTTVLAFNLLGDALRDVLDPRLRN